MSGTPIVPLATDRVSAGRPPGSVETIALIAVGGTAMAWLVLDIHLGLVAARIFAHAPDKGDLITRLTAGRLFGDILVQGSALATGLLAVLMAALAVWATARLLRGGRARTVWFQGLAMFCLLTVHLGAWGAVTEAVSLLTTAVRDLTPLPDRFHDLHRLSSGLIKAEVVLVALVGLVSAGSLVRRTPAASVGTPAASPPPVTD
jgi:hypothetical protein